MAESTPDIGSLLGDGSEFAGKLTFLGTVRIEGRFEGEILSEGTLVVAGGEVRGKVDVDALVITGGLVDAEVTARSSVELHPPGRLNGTVKTPSLQMEKGAIFRGRCLMPEDPGGEIDRQP